MLMIHEAEMEEGDIFASRIAIMVTPKTIKVKKSTNTPIEKEK